jgi:hypothetical protein
LAIQSGSMLEGPRKLSLAHALPISLTMNAMIRRAFEGNLQAARAWERDGRRRRIAA